MRVLFVTAYPAFPLSHGARMRTFRLAAGLVRAGAAVDLLCPWSPDQPIRSYRCEGVRCRPQLLATAPLLAVSDDWLPSALPVSWQASLPGTRWALRASDAYDVVQFEVAGHGSWMRRLAPGVRRVYGAHNVEADLAHARAGTSWLRRRMARRVATLEGRTVAASDLVVSCTESDARRFVELYGEETRCVVIPNGFDDTLLELDRSAIRSEARANLGIGERERLLLFVGGGADHNRQAARFLEEEVLPRLGPETRLVVAGKAAEALGGAAGQRSRALGFVDDLRPLLAAADVAVNPVAYGSGSNLKMAEYLAAGLPVVSTPVGARGFERYADRLRLAELDEFAAAVEEAPQPGGPPAAIEELAWSRLARRLHRAYAELLAEDDSRS